jgi:hypothetical protein
MDKEIELGRIGKMMGFRRKQIIQSETRINQHQFNIMKLQNEIKDLEKKYHEVKNAN